MCKRLLAGALCAFGAALALAICGSIVSAWGAPTCDFLTGGGFIYPSGPYSGKKANFGVGGGCKNGSFWGHLEYQDKAANLNVHWKTITAYLVDNNFFPDPKARLICGTAKANGQDVTFIVRAKDDDHLRDGDDDDWNDWDDDEDGRNKDEFDIKLQGVTYSTFASGPHKLGGGNIRLHKPHNPGDFGGSCPGLPPQKAPDVSVSKTTSTPTVAVGAQAKYNITVTAGGTGNSTNVILNDALQAGHTWTVSGLNAASCTMTGNNLKCTFGTMASGTTKSIVVSTTAKAADCPGGLNNTATVTADVDANGNNNSSGPIHITVNCQQTADVSVSKTTTTPIVTPAPSVPSPPQVRYDLVVHNAGPGTATSVTVTDNLPTGTSTDGPIIWSIVQPPSGCSISSSPDFTTQTLSCFFASLAPGPTNDITISVTATAQCPSSAGETLNNQATVSAGNEAVAQQGNNASQVASIRVNPCGE